MPLGCVVLNCEKAETLHRFPNHKKFPERFEQWVRLVGGTLKTPADYETYSLKRICTKHFADKYRNRFKRLNALAVPSLHLPRVEGTSNDTIKSDDEINPDNESNPDDQLATSSAPAATTVSEDTIIYETFKCEDESAPDDPLETSHDTRSGVAVTYLSIRKTCNEDIPADPLAIIPEPAVTAVSVHTVSREPVVLEKPSVTVTSSCFSSRPPAVTSDGGYRRSAAANALEHNYALVVNNPGSVKISKNDVRYSQLLKKKIRSLQSQLYASRKLTKSYKSRLAKTKLSDKVLFQRTTKSMTRTAQLFAHMQLQNKKKPNGRRFSVEEKKLSLSLYEKSSKAYGLLRKYLTLPSTRAMKKLLRQVRLTPGINPVIFDKIKEQLAGKKKCDRLCTLIFGEMAITPTIAFDPLNGEMQGLAANQEAAFADHALVFMVKGVNSHYKRPIAYFFTTCLNDFDLKNYITTVIQHALAAGLVIVSTICTHSPLYVGAISLLVDEAKTIYLVNGKQWRHDMICIEGQDIVPLYDTPYIIKEIRNNLLTKDLVYMMNNQQKVIKWEYFQMIYIADKSYGELRLLDKLTAEHVTPDETSKLRVKSATQIFSHSVAVVAEHLTARGDLPEECRHIIDFTLLIDNLFDTLNVSSPFIPNGKIYKGPVKRGSAHHAFWKKAKSVLNTVTFLQKIDVLDKYRLTEASVPSITHLIKTIEGVESLWKILSSRKYNFDVLLTRHLNRDPLEKFFKDIRSYGESKTAVTEEYVAPNMVTFEEAFKDMWINDF